MEMAVFKGLVGTRLARKKKAVLSALQVHYLLTIHRRLRRMANSDQKRGVIKARRKDE